MAHYSVRFADAAKNDLREIGLYISTELSSPETAFEVTRTLRASTDSLSFMPRRCALVDDARLAAMGFRKLPIKNYIAFFTIDEKTKTVNVERVLYARRDWVNIL